MDFPPDDGFKWFGEGFEGFPKHLPDDTIEYMIYILDSKSSDAEIRSRLGLILQWSTDQAKKLLKDYIWQRESYALHLKREHDRWFLHGRTSFGDSIADEWLIVYLLRSLSKEFLNAWVRVHDSDGEFLLIEAANTLPKWLNPEIADNRVWISQGSLKVMSIDTGDANSRNLTLQQALSRISANPASLLHSSLIEDEAFFRLNTYPEAIKDSMHATLVTVPRKLAYILHAKAAYTSPAVEAFYLRDPISLKPLNESRSTAATQQALRFPPEDFVTVSARFNRASFAQLKSQEFSIPKAWEKAPFPASTDPNDVARRELGLRLACGMEMLIQDPHNEDKKAVREIELLLGDLTAGEDELPTDSEISSWNMQEDSDCWMDINFEDFQAELEGKKAMNTSNDSTADQGAANEAGQESSKGSKGAFGDKAAQENLRRMVERFEKWMNDDDAGADGAETPDEMDFDEDEEDEDEGSVDEDLSEEGEDKAVSFDEEEFRRAMRQIMGLPDDENPLLRTPVPARQGAARKGKGSEIVNAEADDEESEDEEIRLLTERMEAELKASGALQLNPETQKVSKKLDVSARSDDGGKTKADLPEDADENSEEEGDVQIDYNLAMHMLEAFKGQTGMAGPAGNMMGLMGIHMPRDEKAD